MKMKDWKFTSVEELLVTSLCALDEADPYLGEFAPRELERLPEEGLNSGPPVSGEIVQARIDAILNAARDAEQNAPAVASSR
jgi:hypothetical protein